MWFIVHGKRVGPRRHWLTNKGRSACIMHYTLDRAERYAADVPMCPSCRFFAERILGRIKFNEMVKNHRESEWTK